MTASYRKQFTETLANLFLAEFGSLEDGIKSVSEKASVSEDTLVRFLSGEDYPSMQTAARIGKCISVLNSDPSANFGFLQLATAARNEVAEFSSVPTKTEEPVQETYQDQDFSTQQQQYPQQQQYAQQEVYAQQQPVYQTVTQQVPEDILEKINQLETELYNYKSMIDKQTELNATQQEVTELLHLLAQRSNIGIEKGWLPPAVRNKLFENINEHNAYASFSSICQDKEIDPYVELYAISYALDLFESFGNQMAMFSSTEPEQIDYRQYELEQQIEKQAELNFRLFKQNGAFLVDYPAEVTKE